MAVLLPSADGSVPAQQTINYLENKTNSQQIIFGNTTFPADTVRLETVETEMVRTPDGQTCYNLLCKFLVRMLYDEYYDAIQDKFIKGWVGWNWQYGVPAGGVNELGVAMLQRAGYYPVCWNGGFFQLFGTNHPLFLQDNAANPNTLIANLGAVPAFMMSLLTNTGFYVSQ